MPLLFASCVASYYAKNKRNIVVGTKGTIVGATTIPVPSVQLDIEGSEKLDVSLADLSKFWRTFT
jgi:hypothetical protein